MQKIMTILQVKVIPNASKNSIEGFHGDALKIKITAPPDKGKANQALIEYLSEQLDIPKSQIEILSGETSRMKKIKIHGNIDLKKIF